MVTAVNIFLKVFVIITLAEDFQVACSLEFNDIIAEQRIERRRKDAAIDLFSRVTNRPMIKEVTDHFNERVRLRGEALVQTDNGLIRGYRDKEKYNFLGIRYGQAPIGERR